MNKNSRKYTKVLLHMKKLLLNNKWKLLLHIQPFSNCFIFYRI